MPLTENTQETFSGEDGRYKLSVPDKQLPDSFAILASGEEYVPDSRNITKTADTYKYVVDFSMEKIPPDMIILEIEPALHHLGDGAYEGAINSQFQSGAEGTGYTKTFDVNDFHLSFSKAEISLFAKGLQAGNRLNINGNLIGYMSSSPSDGSFGTLSWTFETSILVKRE